MKILCVFDAQSGFLGEINYFFKKNVLGKPCAMCSISHNFSGVKKEWKDMAQTLKHDLELLHIDEMDTELAEFVQQSTPCVVASMKDGFRILAKKEELTSCAGNIDSFKKLLDQKIVFIERQNS